MIEPCNCNEYIFEHTALNGKCLGTQYGPICGECEKPCEWDAYMEEDFEGMDYPVLSSKCCGGEVFSCPELYKEYEPTADDEVDGDYIGARGRVLFEGWDG